MNELDELGQRCHELNPWDHDEGSPWKKISELNDIVADLIELLKTRKLEPRQ